TGGRRAIKIRTCGWLSQPIAAVGICRSRMYFVCTRRKEFWGIFRFLCASFCVRCWYAADHRVLCSRKKNKRNHPRPPVDLWCCCASCRLTVTGVTQSSVRFLRCFAFRFCSLGNASAMSSVWASNRIKQFQYLDGSKSLG
ncbi:unnamed protein product, partial [Hapterophycus canaliculatus]